VVEARLDWRRPFFVLSGFLISGLLFAEYKKSASINFKRFLIRRGLKIYPSFYLLVAMVMGYSFCRSYAPLAL
jgi:peptidoglycan/LPS O-acetylase OafA/YrhL